MLYTHPLAADVVGAAHSIPHVPLRRISSSTCWLASCPATQSSRSILEPQSYAVYVSGFGPSRNASNSSLTTLLLVHFGEQAVLYSSVIVGMARVDLHSRFRDRCCPGRQTRQPTSEVPRRAPLVSPRRHTLERVIEDGRCILLGRAVRDALSMEVPRRSEASGVLRLVKRGVVYSTPTLPGRCVRAVPY